MKTRKIDGVQVLQPATAEEMRRALESGRPFQASEKLEKAFGLSRDLHLVDGNDAGVLDPEEAA